MVCCSAPGESINSDRVRRNRKSAHAREMGVGETWVGVEGGGVCVRVSDSERKKESESEKVRESQCKRREEKQEESDSDGTF